MKHTWIGLSAKESVAGSPVDLTPVHDALSLTAAKTEAVAISIQDLADWTSDVENTVHALETVLELKLASLDARPQFDKAEFERRLGAEVASIRNETALRVKALESATKNHVEAIQGDLATLHSLERFLVKDLEDLEKQVSDEIKAIANMPHVPQVQKVSTWPAYVAMVLAILAIALHFIPL